MYVYVIGPANGPYKIGFTSNLKKRLGALQNASPLDMIVHHQVQVTDIYAARDVEAAAHAKLASYRLRGEWFSCEVNTACEAVASNASVGSARRSGYDNRKDRENELRYINGAMTDEKFAEMMVLVGCPHTDRESFIQWRLDRQEEEMSSRARRRT